MFQKKFHTYIYIVTISILLFSCAQIIPLTGGDKDILPPKPISFSPAEKSTNFNGKTIQIDFDEYIQLKEAQKQITINPNVNQFVNYTVDGKSLLIKFESSLKANTTYTINFGNAIVDTHEGNVLRNFTYTFSTGINIDTLTLSGRIKNHLFQKPLGDISVFLYENLNDSCVYKEQPNYFTKTNAEGFYTIKNIKPAKYKLFVLDDRNNNKLFDENEAIGFYNDSFIELNKNDSFNTSIFTEIPQKTFIKKVEQPYHGLIRFIFNKEIDQPSIKVGNETKNQIPENDTLNYYYSNWFKKDSVEFEILSNSNLIGKLWFENKFKTIEDIEKSKLSKSLLLYADPGKLIPGKYLSIESAYILDKPLSNFELFANNKLIPTVSSQIENRLNPNYPCTILLNELVKENTQYTLKLKPNSISSNSCSIKDSLIFNFKSPNTEELCKLDIEFKLPTQKNLIIQLLNLKNEVCYETIVNTDTKETNLETTKHITFNYITPNTYTLRVISDDDKNNKFTSGNYIKRNSPENIFVFSKPIKLLMGWEIELNCDVLFN